MDLFRVLVVSSVVLVFLGLGVVFVDTDETDLETEEFCQGIEEDFHEDPETVGNLTCHLPDSPEVGEINVSGEIADRTQVACVCLYELDGEEEVITVSRPS